MDEGVAEYYLSEDSPPGDVLKEGIRNGTLALRFVPVRPPNWAPCVCEDLRFRSLDPQIPIKDGHTSTPPLCWKFNAW